MVIDEEFAQLIPPLTDDEFKGLEASIVAEGCRDSLIVWGDVLIDGHNRYKICSSHDIPFNTVQMNFVSRDEALLWVMRNQLSKRNLNDLQRIELVRKCEDAVKAQAKERQLAGLIQNEDTVKENFPERENSGKQARDELGAMAGVSGRTYEHATEMLDKAPEPVVEAARNKELSIDAAYEVTKMPQEQQAEISERIEHGEKPKAVVADVKKRQKQAKRDNKAKRSESTQEDSKVQLTLEGEPEDMTAETSENETSSEKYKVISLSLGTEFNRDYLVKLHVENLVADDCALFLWCSYQVLPEIFKAALWENWGLKYQTVAFMSSKELCILAIRGDSMLNDTSLPKVVESYEQERQDLIKGLTGNVPVCELQ
jgi:hypothetical protein